MDFQVVLNYLSEYGLFFMALIIFLEYLNLPGFPAGIIMPVAGMWIATTNTNLALALTISVVSALVASWILYVIGLRFGDALLTWYSKKFPKQYPYLEKQMSYLRQKGSIGVFVSKLIPMARTIIGLPAGVLKVGFWKYTVASTLGIIIWNGVFILSGYYFSDQVLARWM